MQHETHNPLKALDRVWRIAERVTVTGSVLMIVGTVGYLSLLKL